MSPQPTPAQDKVFKYIKTFYRTNHRPPTYREIADGMDRTYNWSYRCVHKLADAGRIYIDATRRIRIKGLRIVIPRDKRKSA